MFILSLNNLRDYLRDMMGGFMPEAVPYELVVAYLATRRFLFHAQRGLSSQDLKDRLVEVYESLCRYSELRPGESAETALCIFAGLLQDLQDASQFRLVNVYRR